MENNTQTEKRTFEGFDGHIGWGTRLAYAGGDVACNIVFGMIGTLLTFFYTEVAGINAGVIGLIMLGSRVFDGFSDVIMGIIVEKTHSRFGKARPWLLWMSVPFCASAVILFTVPQVSQDLGWVKVLYVIVTYNFCTTICYTAINLPYGTLSTFMTRSSHERDMVGNVRMGLSPLGKILAVFGTPFLVAQMGGERDQSAWAKAMLIWASVGLVLLLINFIFCKEKVNPELEKKSPEAKRETKKLPMKKALKFLVKNQYFWAVLLLWMFQSVSFGVVGTTLPYYNTYVLNMPDTQYSWFFLVETLTLVAGVFICMPLVKKIGKRNLALGGAIIALLGQVMFAIFTYAVSATSLPMLYAICIIRSIGLAPLNAVVFGMLGDVVDFGHWKNGVRQEAFISAGGSVGTKLGSGLASVVITQLLNLAGYKEGGVAQTEGAVNMMKALYVWGPLVIAVGVTLVLVFYKLDKKYDAMMLALTKREWEETKSKRVEKDIALATKQKEKDDKKAKITRSKKRK